jgi:hypothetical protein
LQSFLQQNWVKNQKSGIISVKIPRPNDSQTQIGRQGLAGGSGATDSAFEFKGIKKSERSGALRRVVARKKGGEAQGNTRKSRIKWGINRTEQTEKAKGGRNA